jgi:hypothetical protein
MLIGLRGREPRYMYGKDATMKKPFLDMVSYKTLRHEDVLWSGDIAPRILDLGTRRR